MTYNKESIDKLFACAELFEEQEQYDKAIDIYSRLIEFEPEEPKWWAFRGYCKYFRKTYRGALADFGKAISMKPDVPTILYFRAQTYRHLDLLDEAIEDYKRSIVLKPAADAYTQIGGIHEYRKNLEESKLAYEAALAIEPNDETIKHLQRVKRKIAASMRKNKT